MIQPSIHKRDIESNRIVVCGALFDMRDLAQMLAHVRDAAKESAKFRRRQRSEGRPRSRPPAIDCTGRYVSLTEVRLAAHYGLNLDIRLSPKMGWTGRAPAPNRFSCSGPTPRHASRGLLSQRIDHLAIDMKQLRSAAALRDQVPRRDGP
jgi:hypothetical protein